MTKLLQCLRDELVRRDYAAPTIRTYIQIVEAFHQRTDARLDRVTPTQLRPYHLFSLEQDASPSGRWSRKSAPSGSSARGLGDDVVVIVNEEDGQPVVTLARR